jgi:signal transduction histidine kinase
MEMITRTVLAVPDPLDGTQANDAQMFPGTFRAYGATMYAAEHVVQFYEEDTVLLDSVASFCQDAIQQGGVAIVVATAAHREGIEARLRNSGLDLAADQDQYVALDAAELLDRFMVEGMPDPDRFMRELGELVSRVAAGRREVRVFGEMVALLAAEGNVGGAIALEDCWNALQRTHPFALFCAYPIDRFAGESGATFMREVCAAHGCALPTEEYTALGSDADRLRMVAQLQQKARWLESEIAERRQVEVRLQDVLAGERTARLETEAALRSRDEFLSATAHELRNPLASLLLHAQVALRRLHRDSHLEPGQIEDALQGISAQAARLSCLIDRLLDASHADAGTLELERQVTDLAALARQVVRGVQSRGGGHGRCITLAASDSLHAWVDEERVARVLTDLLDNAIEHGGDGPIEIVVSEAAGGTVELSVRDHGPGIPAERRDRLFERRPHVNGNGASGVGLSLDLGRRVIELHDGQIRVEFPDDGGCRFVVSLPVVTDVRVAL